MPELLLEEELELLLDDELEPPEEEDDELELLLEEELELAVVASVVTTPAGVILRIAALPVSATKRLPLASIVRSAGWLKSALLPAPSSSPAIPGRPAIVVTAPAAVTLRIVELPVSVR